MPGKSRRKHPLRSKKRKTGQALPVTGAQQQAVAQNQEPVAQAPSPSAKAPASNFASPPVTRYPYITAELRRIAILAGIMLVVLVVLYLVVP